ncbi:MAG TPA: polyamine ABC transporter substrate-binding protein, partial [Acidimicrobiia bacterium]|nr:polyamine ABC transporter substrate-binding protein [Acidimicrobiia bacterium]
MKRVLRKVALLATVALIIAACGDGDDSGADAAACEVDQVDGDLNFYNWSEYIDPDLVTAFEEEYDVDVIEDFYESNEAMLAQLQAGAVYDL